MIIHKPELSEFNTDKIIELLDDRFDSLEDLSVTLFMYNSEEKLIMKLAQKLYKCGCQVTIGSSSNWIGSSYHNRRDAFEKSNVVICNLNKKEINGTFHPTPNSIIIDMSGESLNDSFMENGNNTNFYTIITPN